jgi:hypothetical protein
MTQATPTRRGGIAVRLCLAVVVVVVLLGGCQTASGYVGTLIELDSAGISNPSISSSGDQVRLAYDSTAPADELTEEENRAAEVIWKHLPLRFSSLEVDPRRELGVPRTYSRTELEGRFGPRPAGLDKGSGDIEQDFRNTWRNVVRGVLIGLTTLLLLVVLVIVLVVRAVRRRGPTPPAAGWPATATAGGPPPSWPGQPWGAQPPAGQPAPPPQAPWQPGAGQPGSPYAAPPQGPWQPGAAPQGAPYPQQQAPWQPGAGQPGAPVPPQAPWQPGAGQPGAPAPPPQPAWQPGTGQPAWQPPPAQPAWQPPPAPAPPTHEPTRKLDQPDETLVEERGRRDEGDAQETRRIPPDATRRPADDVGPDDETRPLGDQERGGPTPPP